MDSLLIHCFVKFLPVVLVDFCSCFSLMFWGNSLYSKQIISLSENTILFFPGLFLCFDLASGDFCNPENLLLASFLLHPPCLCSYWSLYLEYLFLSFVWGTPAHPFRPDWNVTLLGPPSPRADLATPLSCSFHTLSCLLVMLPFFFCLYMSASPI